jgi:hypothetical protein
MKRYYILLMVIASCGNSDKLPQKKISRFKYNNYFKVRQEN